MTDRISAQHRSWNMSRIRGRDTTPEIRVRSLLHSLGYRFRLHRTDLPGTPDILLPRYKTAILVHGCFWHRHAGCKFAYKPKSRTDFWNAKFQRNVAHDQEVNRQLKELGWSVITVWECEVPDEKQLSMRLVSHLSSVVKTGPIEFSTCSDN